MVFKLRVGTPWMGIRNIWGMESDGPVMEGVWRLGIPSMTRDLGKVPDVKYNEEMRNVRALKLMDWTGRN
jgi:hypothetical protein